MHPTSVSTQCKVALLAALRGHQQDAPAPAPSQGSQAEATKLRQCMPGIMRTCQPQVVELMANPLDTDGASLVQCAQAHSSTIGGVCERLVERLTRDGFAERLISCGQTFLGLCPVELGELMATEATNTVNWRAVANFLHCAKSKQSMIPETCQIIEDALQKDEDEEHPEDELNDDDDEWDVDPYSYGYGGDNHHDHHHKGGLVGALVALFGCCACGVMAAVVVMRRDEIWTSMQRRQTRHHSGMHFQQIEDEELNPAGRPGATVQASSAPPPFYQPAGMGQDYEKNIVTAQPIG